MERIETELLPELRSQNKLTCPEYYTQFGTKHWEKGMLCAKVYNHAYMVRQISTKVYGLNDRKRLKGSYN